MSTRTYSDNGVPVEITLGPADIHIRPTLEERLSRSYDEYDALLKRHHRLELESNRSEDRLMLVIIALIIVCAWFGSRWLVWEQRAVRAGWRNRHERP